MESPQGRSWKQFRLLDLSALALGGLLTWAAGGGGPLVPFPAAPRGPVLPPRYQVVPGPPGATFVIPAEPSAARSTDRCLVPVDTAALDPRFAVAAPRVDDRMISAPRVAGLPFVRHGSVPRH